MPTAPIRPLSADAAQAAPAGTAGQSAHARHVAPAGVLQVGLVEAPHPGVFFVAHDGARRTVSGVTAELGAALARQLGVPVAYTVFPNSGACTEAVARAAVDLAFMPVDASRREKVAFGPAYYMLESTYLVSAASGIADLAGVDAPGVRVAAIANTTTLRAAARTLTRTVPVAFESVQGAVAALASGQADALALSRDSLQAMLADLPGARVVAGGFQQTGIAIAVPPQRLSALADVTAFLETAKADGTVRAIFDAAGLHHEPVAPAGQ